MAVFIVGIKHIASFQDSQFLALSCVGILKMSDNSWKMMFLLLTRQEFRSSVGGGGVESVKIWKAAIQTVKSEANGLKAF